MIVLCSTSARGFDSQNNFTLNHTHFMPHGTLNTDLNFDLSESDFRGFTTYYHNDALRTDFNIRGYKHGNEMNYTYGVMKRFKSMYLSADYNPDYNNAFLRASGRITRDFYMSVGYATNTDYTTLSGTYRLTNWLSISGYGRKFGDEWECSTRLRVRFTTGSRKSKQKEVIHEERKIDWQ